MKYREFGSTGFKVSALGFGAMRLPSVAFIPQSVDLKKSVKLIRHAVDQGINYIDTALPYGFGASEKAVGMALKDGYRDKVHLVTKLFMPFVRKSEDFDDMLNKQLDKLQTDHIDTYLFHALNRSFFDKVQNLNLIDKMIKAKQQGKIRYIGFSFHDTLPVYKEIVDYFNWDVTQIQYNYMDTGMQATTEGLKYAASKKIAIVIMEPLKGGMLANPPSEAVSVMKQAQVHRTPVDWGLQYLWNLPEVSVVISGMSNHKMVDENCRSADNSGINTLSTGDIEIIDRLVTIYRSKIVVPCTACQYCMNCPQGVNIPQNFALLNNWSAAMNPFFRFLIRRTYKKLSTTADGLNKQKTNGAANLCTACGLCVKKCPQGINIPEELKKGVQVLNKGRSIKDVFGK